MCGPFLWGAAWGFWWIFPAIGLVMCLVMMFRFAGMGHGFACMGGHRAAKAEGTKEG